MFKKAFFATALVGGALLTLGCDGKGGDTGDTGPGGAGGSNVPTETTIDSVAWGCNTTNYFYDIYTVGWSTGGWLFTYQNTASPWNEDHPIPVYEDDPDGYWSRLYLDLESVYPNAGDVQSGVSTLYSCDGDGMQYTLTFVVEVDDMNGVQNVDCAVWGANPDGVDADECARVSPGTATQLR